MASLFASGRIVDLILGFMLLEWIVLARRRSRAGRGLGPLEVGVSLLAGAALLLALRSALRGADWRQIACLLLLALAAHAWDFSRRWTAA